MVDMAEGLTLIEVIETDGVVDYIDIEPPLTGDDMDAIRSDPAFYDFRRTEPLLHAKERTPDRGDTFTEINCAKLREDVEERGLVLNENGLAGQIAELLREHGRKVELVLGMPLEVRRHKFLGFISQTPPDAEA